MGMGEGGKRGYMDKTYLRTLVAALAGPSSFSCFWTPMWEAKIVVSTGLRDKRRTGSWMWVNRKAMRPRLLADELRSGERASGGARNSGVQPSAV